MSKYLIQRREYQGRRENTSWGSVTSHGPWKTVAIVEDLERARQEYERIKTEPGAFELKVMHQRRTVTAMVKLGPQSADRDVGPG